MQAICFFLADFSEVTEKGESYFTSFLSLLVWLHASRFRTAEISFLDLNDK